MQAWMLLGWWFFHLCGVCLRHFLNNTSAGLLDTISGCCSVCIIFPCFIVFLVQSLMFGQPL
jgi:hypothetical protein